MMNYVFLNYDYRLIAVELSRQKELDADPKAIQPIEFVGKLKNVDGINPDGAESMFILKIFENIQETRLSFFEGSITNNSKLSRIAS